MKTGNEFNVCTAGLCVWLHRFVYVCIDGLKSPGVFYYLLAEFKCLKCGLLHSTSYTDLVIHDSSNKMRRSFRPRKLYFEL